MQVCPTKSEPSSISGKAVALFATSASIVKLAGKKASNTVGAPRIPGDRTASASNVLLRREARVKEICRKSWDNWTMWQDVRVASPSKAWRFFSFSFLFVSESSSLLFLSSCLEEEILDYLAHGPLTGILPEVTSFDENPQQPIYSSCRETDSICAPPTS